MFQDRFAEETIAALADDPVFNAVASDADFVSDLDRNFLQYFAIRTRFFDDGLLDAMASGIRQIVVLAAGMDGRTLRLSCPPGTHWYEVDLPDVTALKNELVARSRLTATCERQGVAADLRSDWVSELHEAGFDPSARTAWLLEGVLYYLAAPAVDDLIATVTSQSVPGSRIFLDHLQASALYSEESKGFRERVAASGSQMLSARDDIGTWLAGFGWRARAYSSDDRRIGHGRVLSPIPPCWVVSGELGGPAAA